MKYTTLDGKVVQAVRVTAADFNGKEFDGSPFECDVADKIWLRQAMAANVLDFHNAGCTDYARWAIKDTFGGLLAVADPGDYLVRVGNDITVVKGDIFTMAFRLLESGAELIKENAEAPTRLEVEVRGTTHSGKSLIAAMIRRFLRQQGFNNVNLVAIEQGAPLVLDNRAADFMSGHRPNYALSFLDIPITILDNCKTLERPT